MHSVVNDGDGEANDEPVELVDDLEDFVDVVEEDVQEIG